MDGEPCGVFEVHDRDRLQMIVDFEKGILKKDKVFKFRRNANADWTDCTCTTQGNRVLAQFEYIDQETNDIRGFRLHC